MCCPTNAIVRPFLEDLLFLNLKYMWAGRLLQLHTSIYKDTSTYKEKFAGNRNHDYKN